MPAMSRATAFDEIVTPEVVSTCHFQAMRRGVFRIGPVVQA
jgi:hypothetical protein